MAECKIIIRNPVKTGQQPRDQMPPVLEGIEWETSRMGAPGKLTFTVIKTPELAFNEGAQVLFYYDGKKVFHGFVFQKQRDKEHHIQVVAYDQLRYLKNKATYVWTGIRADQVLSRIIADFQLRAGDLANTGYVIPKMDCSDQTLFDIALDAIDYTVMATGNLYYIYDDCGKICLKNIKDSCLNLVITESNAENFDYTSSIDSNTYNAILLIDSDAKSSADKATAQDPDNIDAWGMLLYTQSMQNGANKQALAKQLLEQYNHVSRSLTMRGVLGDIRVRGGSGVYLDLDLGDMRPKQRMLVEKAVHHFEEGYHSMDLTLKGCKEFYGE